MIAATAMTHVRTVDQNCLTNLSWSSSVRTRTISSSVSGGGFGGVIGIGFLVNETLGHVRSLVKNWVQYGGGTLGIVSHDRRFPAEQERDSGLNDAHGG